MNKKIRQDLNDLKYRKRVKRYITSGLFLYITRDRKFIYSPTVQDVIDDRGLLFFKTTSTPCSCEMCSGAYKYRRHEQKIINRKLLQEGLEEYLEG